MEKERFSSLSITFLLSNTKCLPWTLSTVLGPIQTLYCINLLQGPDLTDRHRGKTIKAGELASEVRWKLLAFTIALGPHQGSRNSAGKDSSPGAGYLLRSLKGPPLENETLGQPLFIHFFVSSCRKLHSLTYNPRPSEQSGLISLFQPCAPTCPAHIFSPDSGADSLFPELPFHHPSFSPHRESIICSSQINLPLH